MLLFAKIATYIYCATPNCRHTIRCSPWSIEHNRGPSASHVSNQSDVLLAGSLPPSPNSPSSPTMNVRAHFSLSRLVLVTLRYVYPSLRPLSTASQNLRTTLQLQALSDALIPILAQYRQKLFYDEPRFHASIAWALLSLPTQPQDTPHAPGSQGGPSDKDASLTPPPAARDTKSAAVPAASHHEDDENAQNPGPVMSLRTTRSDTDIHANSNPNTHLRNSTKFLTIPSLPVSLVGSLQSQYGATLLARHVGVFDVDEVCVRIGKDVSRWRLAGG